MQQSIQFDHVADLYDSYVRTEFDIAFWLKESQMIGGKVLELACGTGRISIPLLKAGVDLTCVDYAPGMLSVLRGKLEDHDLLCPIYCRDMAELSLPYQYALIFIPFHSFSEVVERDRQREALERVYEHLSDGGTFICALQNPAVRPLTMDGRPHLLGEFPMDDGNRLSVHSQLLFDEECQVAAGCQIYEIMSTEGTLIERRTLNINFYLFRKDEFESLAVRAGFKVLALYGDYEHRPFDDQTSPFMIWKLGKGPS